MNFTIKVRLYVLAIFPLLFVSVGMMFFTQAELQSLNRSNKDLESFAFAISHDLREPLRTIRGFLQIITSNKDKNLQIFKI